MVKNLLKHRSQPEPDDLPLYEAVGVAIKAFLDESRNVTLAGEMADALLADPDVARKSMLLAMFACAKLACIVADDNPPVTAAQMIDAMMEEIANNFD